MDLHKIKTRRLRRRLSSTNERAELSVDGLLHRKVKGEASAVVKMVLKFNFDENFRKTKNVQQATTLNIKTCVGTQRERRHSRFVVFQLQVLLASFSFGHGRRPINSPAFDAVRFNDPLSMMVKLHVLRLSIFFLFS